MKCLKVAVALFYALPVLGQSPLFVWDYAYPPGGTGSFAYNGDATFSASTGGSEIWTATVSGANPNDYEVYTTLSLKSAGGTYMHFLRAGTTVTPGVGSYISVEITVPSGWHSGGSAPIAVNQCSSGTITNIASTSISLHDGDTVRSVVWGTTLWVFVDNIQYGAWTIPATTGQPGFGGYNVPFNGGISPTSGYSAFRIGHHDTVAPSTVSRTSVYSSIVPGSVSLQWQGVADDSAGIGVSGYEVSRNGVLMATIEGAEYTDATVASSTTYTYTVQAFDYHGNVGAATTISVTTPAPGAVDPRRTGLPPTGSYWGGGGEQIDTLSGNLHFSLPMVTAMGRTGWQVPINLVYDSQNWRQDNGVNWQLGSDVGFGFGWRMLIGSITPYYTSTWTGVDHYVYTDSSGAQYRLDQNSGGVWSSVQGGVYVWLDTNVSPNKLHFKDGTFWVMGCTSGGIEADAGTLYPTILEDTSGNQILVAYDTAVGLPYYPAFGISNPNTSARITAINDVRSYGTGAFLFYYNHLSSDTWNSALLTLPHLQSFTNTIGTSESHGFTYSTVSQEPPFGTDPGYSGLTVTLLTDMTTAIIPNYQFGYDSAGAGELMSVIFPYGGELTWNYSSFEYAGIRSLREITGRALAADSAHANVWTYGISRPDAANSVALHTAMTLVDASGIGAKTWNFFVPGGSTPAWEGGLVSQFVQSASSGGTVLQTDTYTWSQDPASRPYISAKTTVISPGASNQQSSLSTQTLDQYGNVTQSVIYPYNNTSTPLRTYNNTYLTDATYLGNYVRNRLLQTTLTTSSGTNTLVENYYDGRTFPGQPSLPYLPSLYCSSSWSGDYGGTVTYEMDPSPPMAFNYRGLMNATTNPAKTTCMRYYYHGSFSRSNATDGSTATASSDSATNFAAPQSLSTQSYSETVGYNSWLGITQTTGMNGEQLSMAYDPYGRPSTGTSPYGATTTYAYPAPSGYMIPLPLWQTKTGPDGFTKTTLDGLGRTISVQRGPDSSHIQSEVDTVYAPCACSPLGKIQKVSQPYAPGATIYWTVYSYDGMGRTLTTVQPDGASTTTSAYSGNQTTTTDPAGNWKQYTTDVLSNLTTVVEPDPANLPGGTLTTSYTYDWMNHISGVSMTRGSTTQTRTFVYSAAGLLTSATNPENGTVQYYYNADNTLWYKHDAKGQDTVYTYDSQKRVTEIQRYPTGKNNSEDTCQRVLYYYDTNPFSTTYTQNSASRLAAETYSICHPGPTPDGPVYTPSTITEMYTYHPAGATTGKEFQLAHASYDGTTSGNVSIAYTYDSKGSVASITRNGVTYTYANDSMGRPVSLTDNEYILSGGANNNDIFVQNVTYDLAGRMTGMQTLAQNFYGIGIYSGETMSYNVNGQLTSISWAGVQPNAGSYGYSGLTGGITYSYSATQNNGQITQASDAISGETINYQYDALKRLTSASSTPISGSTPAAWTQTYQYDGFGNLTAKVLNGTSTPIAVNAATNQLSSAYYDANGNMTSGAGATFTYDEANRIASVAEVSGGIEYYGYAPDNKRVYRLKSDGVTENYTFYGAFGEKLAIYTIFWGLDVNGYYGSWAFNQIETDLWFAGKLIYQATGATGLGSASAVYQDRLGTNRASGARFRPFGEEITSTANDRTKFGTYTRDSYTGLDYADQRYYASTYGRFNTPDPYQGSARLPDPLTWNRYVYVFDDPANGNDPRGLDGSDTDCTNDPWDCQDSGPIGGGGSCMDIQCSGQDSSGSDDPQLPVVYGNCSASINNPLGDCGAGSGFLPSSSGGTSFPWLLPISILTDLCGTSPTNLVLTSGMKAIIGGIIIGAENGALGGVFAGGLGAIPGGVIGGVIGGIIGAGGAAISSSALATVCTQAGVYSGQPSPPHPEPIPSPPRGGPVLDRPLPPIKPGRPIGGPTRGLPLTADVP
jgi:RHS repeat-associated protein